MFLIRLSMTGASSQHMPLPRGFGLCALITQAFHTHLAHIQDILRPCTPQRKHFFMANTVATTCRLFGITGSVHRRATRKVMQKAT